MAAQYGGAARSRKPSEYLPEPEAAAITRARWALADDNARYHTNR